MRAMLSTPKRISLKVAAALLGFGGLCFAGTIHITGTVVDSATSQPIGGARAALAELPGVSAVTSASGTFDLSGTIALPPRRGAVPGGLRLRGNRLIFNSGTGSAKVSVSVYAGDGTCISHMDRATDAAGRLELGNLWRAPGSYAVVVECSGRTYRIAHAGLGTGGDPAEALGEGGRSGPLAKASGAFAQLVLGPKGGALGKAGAAYTLQVSANGYVAKSIGLANADTALGAIALAQEKEQTGVWTNVTPPEMAKDGSGFGAGSIAGDPLRPSDMYVGGSESGLWKSSDYGKTWRKINGISPDVTRGCVIAVAPTTPATIYLAGFGRIFKSVDAGLRFDTLSTGGFDPYSLTVDPYDPFHLLSGLHEAAGVIESTDGGASWHRAGSGTIGGGISVFPFFIDMGDASATRRTWIAIGQNGSSPGRTTDGGATWTMPAGLDGLEHPHGNARIFQQGPNLWMGGAYDFRGTIARSADYGATWSKVTTSEKPEALVWGTSKNVYAMYAWACGGCDVQPNFAHAPLPGGSAWAYEDSTGLKIGPNSLAVADNGTHRVFVGLMWAEGLWRYVEP